jgi:hypothetical protein
MLRLFCAACVCAAGVSVAAAGDHHEAVADSAATVVQTGNLRVDLFGLPDMAPGPRLQEETQELPPYRSPWLAAGFSLVIPGTGELYAGSYVKAAIFFVIEVAAWTVAYTQDRQGDRQTDAFQGFADRNWNVVKYAQYAEATYGPPNGPYNLLIPGTASLPPWQQIDWMELNRMERDIGGNSLNPEGRYFSHTLPQHGEQQYYEEIGKYPQYNTGWNDGAYNPGDFQYGDPLTANFLNYSQQRGEANTYYNRATTAVTLAVVNHVLSALDAGWTASSHNTIHASVQMNTDRAGVAMHPVLKIGYSF